MKPTITADDYTMFQEHNAGASWRELGALRGISHTLARRRGLRAGAAAVPSYPAKEPPTVETGAAENPGAPKVPPTRVTGPGEPEAVAVSSEPAELLALPAGIERRPASERVEPASYRFAFPAQKRLDDARRGDWIWAGTATPMRAVKLQATEGRTPEEAAAFQAKADEYPVRGVTFVAVSALVRTIKDAENWQDVTPNDWREGATSPIIIPLKGTSTPEEESAEAQLYWTKAEFHLAEFVKRGWAAKPEFKHNHDLAVFYAVLWDDWSAHQLYQEAIAVRWEARQRGIYPGQKKADTRDHRVKMDEWHLDD